MKRVDEGDRKGVGERIGERNSGVVTYDGVEGGGDLGEEQVMEWGGEVKW